MKQNPVTRLANSDSKIQAVGNYTHITKIEPNATFYTFSGQIGTDINGIIPTDFNEQVDNTFMNISNLLEHINLSPDNIIKVNIWATEEIDWEHFYHVYNSFFKTPYPSMTIGYVTALGLKEIKIEIEVWAAQ